MRYVVVITGGECEQAGDGRPCVVGAIGFDDREEARSFIGRLPAVTGEVAHFMTVQSAEHWLPPEGDRHG